MKKYLSVTMLICRSFIYKFLLILALMAAVETGIFAAMPDRANRMFFELVDSGRLYFVFVGAVLLSQLLMLTVCSSPSAKPRYTLARLRVSERGIMYCQWLIGALAFLILWAWQALLLLALAKWHLSFASSDYVSHQSIYLAAFRSYFIHSVLPFEDMSRFIRNIIFALSISAAVAAGVFKLRRGKKAVFAIAFICVLFVFTFRAEPFELSYDAFVMFFSCLVAAISLVGVYSGTEEVDYEEADPENQTDQALSTGL